MKSIVAFIKFVFLLRNDWQILCFSLDILCVPLSLEVSSLIGWKGKYRVLCAGGAF